MKLKALFVLFFAALAFLFIGVINRDYEFDNPKLCLKYPGNKRYLYIPDEGSKNAITLRREFNEVYELNKGMALFGEIAPLLIIQFLMTFIFARVSTTYRCYSALVDLFLFLISFFVLGTTLSISLYWNYYRQHIWLIVLGLLAFNYLLNFLFRNFLFVKIEKSKNHDH